MAQIMPMFCKKCGAKFEIRTDEPPRMVCPTCGSASVGPAGSVRDAGPKQETATLQTAIRGSLTLCGIPIVWVDKLPPEQVVLSDWLGERLPKESIREVVEFLPLPVDDPGKLAEWEEKMQELILQSFGVPAELLEGHPSSRTP